MLQQNDGNVLTCTTTLALGLIQPCTRLDYLPPRASLVTSIVDHPKKTKSQVAIYSSRKEYAVSNQQQVVPRLVTTKEQILQRYPDVFDGIGCSTGHPYHIQLDPNVTPKKTLC